MSDGSDAAKLSRRAVIKGAGAGVAAFSSFAASRRPAGAAARTTVSLWGNHPEWQAPMRALLDAFEAANPDIRINLTEVADYSAKLDTAVAGGQPSDILGLGEGTLTRWLATGEPPLLDLTGKIDLSGLTDSARSQVTINGRDYGCPLASYTVGLAIQRPLFAKHGLTPPRSWSELTTVSKTLRDAGETAIVVGGKAWIHTFFMYIGLASSVLGPDGVNAVRSGARKLTDPDLVAAAQLLLDLKSFYNAGFEATDYETAKAIFAKGRGAMMAAGTADVTGFRQVNPAADLSFIAWPGPLPGQSATTTGFELLYGVSAFASADKQAAATRFVNWLASAQAQQIVSDTISAPVSKAVARSSDPIRDETIAASRAGEVPVWYDLPEFGAMVVWAEANFGGLWSGELTAAQFAAGLQAAISPSGASPTAAA